MQFNKKDIKWAVDKENRIVRAFYTFDRDEAVEELENIMRKAFSNQHMFIPVSEILIAFPNNYVTLTATAKCHPEDEFDVQKGMQICYYRLLRRFYEEKHSLTVWYTSILEKTIDRYFTTLRSLEDGYAKVSFLLNDGDWDKTLAELQDAPSTGKYPHIIRYSLRRMLAVRTIEKDPLSPINRKLRKAINNQRNAASSEPIPPFPIPEAGKRTFVKGGIIKKGDK